MFAGTFTALVTPFKNDQIDEAAFAALIEAQIAAGITGIVPVGTTGESPTLDDAEHRRVIELGVQFAKGRCKVIGGTGSNSTREAVAMTVEAEKLGCDGALLVAPYYNKPGPEGLYRHFCAVADSTDRPIILYSIPGRCGIEIGIPVVERLRKKYKHVRWIKEAGGSVDRVDQLKQALGTDITVLSGDDSLTLPFMAVGAEGVISVGSNLYVREISQMVKLALAGDFTRARKAHQRLYPMFKAIFIESNPSPIKFALVRAGIIASAEVRLPLTEISATSAQALTSVLAGLDR